MPPVQKGPPPRQRGFLDDLGEAMGGCLPGLIFNRVTGSIALVVAGGAALSQCGPMYEVQQPVAAVVQPSNEQAPATNPPVVIVQPQTQQSQPAQPSQSSGSSGGGTDWGGVLRGIIDPSVDPSTLENALQGGTPSSGQSNNSQGFTQRALQNGGEVQKLTPLEQSYVAPDGTIGWIRVEIGKEPITKVFVTDANGEEICRGYQFTPAMTDYNNRYDTATDGITDNRTRVTERGIIDKFCGIGGYLFYKTPDTSNMFQGSIPDTELLARLLPNSVPEVFGYSWNSETNELIPHIVYLLPDFDDTTEFVSLDTTQVL